VDRARSIVDPARVTRNRRLQAPLLAFTRRLAQLAEAHRQGARGPVDPGAQAIDWLDAWASADALAIAPNRQSAYIRTWRAAELGLVFGLVRDAAGADARTRIAAWLGRLAARVAERFLPWPLGAAPSIDRRNNHLCWAGAAAAAIATAVDDDALLDWAVAIADHVAGSADEAGSLPLERRRGALALHYHAFSLSGLATIEACAQANGRTLAADAVAGMARIVDGVLAGLAAPDAYAGRVAGGVPQEPLEPHVSAWMELRYRAGGDPRLAPFLRRLRPIPFLRLDGAATYWFGDALPETIAA